MRARLPRWTPFVERESPFGDDERVYTNSRYQVVVRRMNPIDGRLPVLVHLSIKRLDREPVGSERYRDFELMKDIFIGAECEAVELYPARSREADASTQYHLWGFADPTFRFPFGYADRLVIERPEQIARGSAARQNPFEPHHPR